MRIRTIFINALIVIFFLLLSSLNAQIKSSSPAVVLSNDLVRFEFEGENMGLSGMIDLTANVNHIQPVEGKHTLWEVNFGRGTQERAMSNTRFPCTVYRVDNLPDGTQKATFEWLNLEWMREEKAVNVRVTVELPRNSGIATWRINVDNECDYWGLKEVNFPRFNGYLKSGDYDVAFPRRNWGKLFKNCTEELSFEYPYGWQMPLQFLCAMKGKNAIYMATEDPQAWYKKFTINPGKEFTVKTFVEDMCVPGSDHKDPFPVKVGVYQGGWLDGCKMYRNFAVTAPWTSEGKVNQRASMPEALKNVGLWMIVSNYIGPESGTLAEKDKPLLDAQKYFDVPLAAHWYNWHVIKFDNNYPHYLPTKPGVPDQVRDLVSHGLMIMPYINGRIVDTFNDDFNQYLPYATKDQMGKPHLEIYGTESGRLTSMCVATEFWQNKVAEIVKQLGSEVGVDAVYIDQIAAGGPRLCFDKSHGHPLGGGHWWVDGYRQLLKKVQQVAHSEGRNMTITTECAAEPFMDGVDAFLIWVMRDERDIPMMTSVYSGYSIYFTSPARFDKGDRSWIMVQGRDFTWGCQNGWMSPQELLSPEHAKKAEYLKKIGKYRVATKKFLTYGELAGLVEPTNRIETVTECWPNHNGEDKNATLPSAQGAIWKSEDGSLGIFLVNYLERENTIEYTIDPAAYGIESCGKCPFKISTITIDGNSGETAMATCPIKRSEKLGPYEIKVLEIVKGCLGSNCPHEKKN